MKSASLFSAIFSILINPIRMSSLSSASIAHSIARTRPARRTPPSTSRTLTRASAVGPAGPNACDVLNQRFGIKGSVAFAPGKNDLPRVLLTHKNGSTSEVYLFGATVTSWTQPSGDEVLYVRPDATYDKSKPIAGGAPLCFPQFGPGVMQRSESVV